MTGAHGGIRLSRLRCGAPHAPVRAAVRGRVLDAGSGRGGWRDVIRSGGAITNRSILRRVAEITRPGSV